jgi:hypothetical protein
VHWAGSGWAGWVGQARRHHCRRREGWAGWAGSGSAGSAGSAAQARHRHRRSHYRRWAGSAGSGSAGSVRQAGSGWAGSARPAGWAWAGSVRSGSPGPRHRCPAGSGWAGSVRSADQEGWGPRRESRTRSHRCSTPSPNHSREASSSGRLPKPTPGSPSRAPRASTRRRATTMARPARMPRSALQEQLRRQSHLRPRAPQRQRRPRPQSARGFGSLATFPLLSDRVTGAPATCHWSGNGARQRTLRNFLILRPGPLADRAGSARHEVPVARQRRRPRRRGTECSAAVGTRPRRHSPARTTTGPCTRRHGLDVRNGAAPWLPSAGLRSCHRRTAILHDQALDH